MTNQPQDEYSVEDAIAQTFPGQLPLVVRLALDKGYGTTFLSLKRKMMAIPIKCIAPDIFEALQAVMLSACENQYCTIMHSSQLMELGFSLDEVHKLIEGQRLPDRIRDKEIWENTLNRVGSAFRGPHIASTLYASLHEIHDANVVDGINAVVAFSLFHKFFLDAYSNDLKVAEEPLLLPMTDDRHKLIDYLEFRSVQHGGIVTICSICIDLETDGDWTPIEGVVGSLPANTQFSHGVCPRCVVRWRNLNRRVAQP